MQGHAAGDAARVVAHREGALVAPERLQQVAGRPREVLERVAAVVLKTRHRLRVFASVTGVERFFK